MAKSVSVGAEAQLASIAAQNKNAALSNEIGTVNAPVMTKNALSVQAVPPTLSAA